MKTILGGIALSAMLAAPAMAADMPARMPVKAPAPAMVVAAYNWSGFYIGAHGGWGRGDVDAVGVDAAGVAVLGTSISGRVDGAVAGGHAGFNMQFGGFVLGAEVAGSWADLDGSVTCPVTTFTCTAEIDRLFRAGGRGGFAVNNWLIYVTGGWARARVETDSFTTATGVPFPGFRDARHHSGWYLGGGIEYGLTPNLIIGVEGFHVDLEDRIHSATPFVLGVTRRVETDFNVIQGRISWKFGAFGGPVVARY
jgi:outer membrane immunogenic protein